MRKRSKIKSMVWSVNMHVYITGASNKPSGGVKVMNQVAVLFEEHGFESVVVPADGSGQATFLDQPAKTISVEEYAGRLREDDITIDFWPDKRLVDIAAQKKNASRIFWQHGASIPVGGTTVGDTVFLPGNPYTQHWNVSRACADYFQTKYNLSMPIVHPFFDSPTMLEFQERPPVQREGFLLLARRGQKYLPAIRRLLTKHRLTILKEPYHERAFFEALRRHTFFISTDDGIHAPSLARRGKNVLRWLLSPTVREQARRANQWIIPDGHLLGFPMPPVEAAWLGCVTIGFAMGGGIEWMKPNNCLLAQDASKKSLSTTIDQALHLANGIITAMRKQARLDTSNFCKKQTWADLKRLLSL